MSQVEASDRDPSGVREPYLERVRTLGPRIASWGDQIDAELVAHLVEENVAGLRQRVDDVHLPVAAATPAPEGPVALAPADIDHLFAGRNDDFDSIELEQIELDEMEI